MLSAHAHEGYGRLHVYLFVCVFVRYCSSAKVWHAWMQAAFTDTSL